MRQKQLVIVTSTLAGMLILAGSFALLAGQETTPAAEANAVWTYLTETNPYDEWKPWPGHEGFLPGTSPHGAFLKLYVNEPALKALEAGSPLPSGAIVVKENYGPDKETLAAVTPMYRVANYHPDAGNWFWAKYGSGGEVQASGKVESCIDCHSSAEGDDWLFTTTE